MDSIIAKSFLATWAEFGMEIDNFKGSMKFPTIYISVPESSEYLNKDGQQMAGEVLAKRIKELCNGMGRGNFNLKYRVRRGEHWTKQMGKAALAEKSEMIGLYGVK